MAITIKSVPADYGSLHDDLWFVVSSNNASLDNFKYVFDVNVSGSLVARVKTSPNPSGEGSYGIFNSAPIVRNYLTNYFEPSGTTVLQHTSDRIKIDYTIQYGEEVSGTLTTNLASGAYSGYNSYPPLFFDSILTLGGGGDLLLSTQYENLLLGNYTDQWLTDRDKDNIELIYGKKLFISWLKDIYNNNSVEVQKINEDGSNSGVSSVGSGLTLTGEFNLFNFSAANINTYLGSTFIAEQTYGYKVRLGFAYLSSNNLQLKNDQSASPYKDTNLRITNNTTATQITEIFANTTELHGARVGHSLTVLAHPIDAWVAAGFQQLRVLKNGTEVYNQTASTLAGSVPADLSYTFTVETGAVYDIQTRSTAAASGDAWTALTGGTASIDTGLYSNWLTIKHVCYERTNPVNVHFLNQLGGWDSFGFNLINKRSTEFDRKSFRRAAYQLDGFDMRNIDGFNRFNEGTINFSTQHKDAYKLISDYISEEDYHWLAQLIGSPIVYLEVRGAYFPIVMKTNNYTYKLDKSEQLFNLEIDIEVSKYNNSQYR